METETDNITAYNECVEIAEQLLRACKRYDPSSGEIHAYGFISMAKKKMMQDLIDTASTTASLPLDRSGI